MARFDYRRQYKDMSIEKLREHMQHNKDRYDHFFVSAGGSEIAEQYHRTYSYLKSKIEKLEKAKNG